MYVCLCKGLRETDIQQVALNGMVNAETVAKTFGLDDEDCCGRCARNIHELVALATANVCATRSKGCTALPSTCGKHA